MMLALLETVEGYVREGKQLLAQAISDVGI